MQEDHYHLLQTLFQESFIRVTSVPKSDLVMAEVTKMKTQVVTGLNVFLLFVFISDSPFKILIKIISSQIQSSCF